MTSNAEQQLAEQIAQFSDDPYQFVLFAFPWGESGTPLEQYNGPDEWQTELLKSVRDHIRSGDDTALREAIASGHGVGKTAVVAMLIIWAMSTRPHMAGVVTANTQQQLKSKTWRELSIWHKRAINAHWFKWTATSFYAIESPETWCVNAIPQSENNPEAFAGLHAEHVMVIYDEASAIPDSIWEVTEGAMTTSNCFWFAFGNPTRNTGRFRECWRAYAHRWNTRRVDSRDSRMANQQEIEQWIADYGEDSDFVRIRVKGVFPRMSSTQLISEEAAENARLRVIPQRVVERYPVVLGVDVARKGDDRAVIIKRQGPKAWMPEQYRELSTMALAGIVFERWQESGADAVCVDGIGVGAGVVDRLEELGAPVVDVQSAATAEDNRQYRNARAEIWGRMAEWLEDASIPDMQDLIVEMTAMEYALNDKLQYVLESTDNVKERIGVSPDLATALAMTMADTNRVARLIGQEQSTPARPIRNASGMGAWT